MTPRQLAEVGEERGRGGWGESIEGEGGEENAERGGREGGGRHNEGGGREATCGEATDTTKRDRTTASCHAPSSMHAGTLL